MAFYPLFSAPAAQREYKLKLFYYLKTNKWLCSLKTTDFLSFCLLTTVYTSALLKALYLTNRLLPTEARGGFIYLLPFFVYFVYVSG